MSNPRNGSAHMCEALDEDLGRLGRVRSDAGVIVGSITEDAQRLLSQLSDQQRSLRDCVGVDWQSPAAQAFRETVNNHQTSLSHVGEIIDELITHLQRLHNDVMTGAAGDVLEAPIRAGIEARQRAIDAGVKAVETGRHIKGEIEDGVRLAGDVAEFTGRYALDRTGEAIEQGARYGVPMGPIVAGWPR